jgi:hypothetical protein
MLQGAGSGSAKSAGTRGIFMLNSIKTGGAMVVIALSLAACSGEPSTRLIVDDSLEDGALQEPETVAPQGTGTASEQGPTAGQSDAPAADSVPPASSPAESDSIPAVTGPTVFTPHVTDIQDDRSFYDRDGYDSTNVIRLDVRTHTLDGLCTPDDLSGCTLADVIADVDGNDDFKVDIAVHLAGDDFPDDGGASNAELRQRGASTRAAPQKSFRIKLDSKDVLWRNERRLQLNKHPFDQSRIRNKLSFDLMRDLPHLPSLRSQFVNLWVDNGAGPVDYGVFTHVEAPGKQYLVNRGLDADDNLYKAEFFLFSPKDLDAMQVDESGEPLDMDLFESRMEIKRGKDHRKLINMLAALSDPDQSFASVLDRYFNANNVLMWVTTNLLLGQQDAVSQNFYLYNPVDSDIFYFLPWDYDGAVQAEPELLNSYADDALRQRLAFGYARSVNNLFLSAYFRLPGAHERIVAAANELRNTWLSDAVIADRAGRYAAAVRPYVSRSPDIENIAGIRRPENMDRYDELIQSLPGLITSNHHQLQTEFSIPMPPFLKNPLNRGRQKVLWWLPAYDVTGNSITYDVEVASSPVFDAGDIVFTAYDIADTPDRVEYAIDVDQFASGNWFFRVTARANSDPQRYWQVANNELVVDGTTHYGVREFVIP